MPRPGAGTVGVLTRWRHAVPPPRRLPSQEVSGLRGHFTDIGAFIGTLNTARVTSPLRCTSYGHAGDTLVRLTQTCPVLLAWAPDESLTADASSPSGSTAVTMQW